ncbi:MAG: hypothetical protein ACKO0W_00060 [Planctomycetota bacterium]
MIHLLAAILLSHAAAFPTPPEPPAAPATPAATPPTSPEDRVAALLGELEKTATTIDTMGGRITLERFDSLLGETERRFGRLVLDRKDGARRFAILFDEFIDGSGRQDKSIDHWIYSGGWLCQQDHRNRSFTKRRVARPGEAIDPLALGEGPIPVPIGQKRAEVLARFTVAETAVPDDIRLLASLKDYAGLRLVPKDGTPMARETEAVELFYDRATLAPVGIVVREKSGNRTVARIAKPVVNGEVSAEDRALLEIPEPDPAQWTISISE